MSMELLERISNVPGVSGFEDEAQRIVERELAGICDEIRRDRIGNVIALKKANRPPSGKPPIKVLYSAHIDEIGFMVQHIDKDGFLRFVPIGGYDPRTLLSQRVIVHGRRDIRGVIAPQPNWILTDEEKKRVLEIRDMIIDVALPGAEVNELVSVGDVISIDQQFTFLNARVVTGRNFDDRLGVYCLVEAMRRIRNTQVDVYAVSSVQEEVGVRGIPSAAYAVEPDIGIAIDGSLSSDVPYAGEKDKHCFMGKGTGIYIMDRLTIGNPRLVRFLIELCERTGIAHQRNIGGGTDASVIQRMKHGALCTTIGAPTRYMHSTVQLAHVDDIEATIELLRTFAEHAHELHVDG